MYSTQFCQWHQLAKLYHNIITRLQSTDFIQISPFLHVHYIFTCCPLKSVGDWFQDPPRIPKSRILKLYSQPSVSKEVPHPRIQPTADRVVHTVFIANNPGVSKPCSSNPFVHGSAVLMCMCV